MSLGHVCRDGYWGEWTDVGRRGGGFYGTKQRTYKIEVVTKIVLRNTIIIGENPIRSGDRSVRKLEEMGSLTLVPVSEGLNIETRTIKGCYGRY